MPDLLAPLISHVSSTPLVWNIVDVMLAGLPESTARTYTQGLRAFAASAGVDPSKYRQVAGEWLQQDEVIRNRAAQHFIDSMSGAGIKPATVQTRLAALKRLLQTAVFHGVCGGVVTVDTMPSIEHSFHGKDAAPADIRAVRNALAHHPHEARRLRDLAILSLLYPTGIRIGGCHGDRRTGILGINRDDVDLASGELRIFLKGRTEQHAIRPDSRTIDQIRLWIEHRDARADVAPLFVGVDKLGRVTSARLVQQTVRNILAEIGRHAGTGRVNPHAFRHAVGTQMLRNAGATVMDVRDQLGHSSVKTSERYVNYQDRAAEVGDKLRDIL